MTTMRFGTRFVLPRTRDSRHAVATRSARDYATRQPPCPFTPMTVVGLTLLGLTAAGRMERPEVTELPLLFPGGGMSLLLMKWKGDAASPDGKPRIGRLILNVPDLKALAARFEAAGYPLKHPIAEQPKYHILVGLIEDPDGNQLELVQRGP